MKANKSGILYVRPFRKTLAISALILMGIGSDERGWVYAQNLSNQVGSLSITNDSSREGWELAIPYTEDPAGDNGVAGQIDWGTITMAHDCDELYVRYEVTDGPPFIPEGYRYNLLVDVDNNPATGYRGIGKSLSIGADVLVQGGQGKVTTFKFVNADNQEAWDWQQIDFYPASDEIKADGKRDIDYRISISDLDVFKKGVASFDWVAWADYSTAPLDYYPDNGNLGDAGNFNTYTLSYKPIDKVFANPERGFFKAAKTNSNNYKPLNERTLNCYRQNEGISLVNRYFYLENFVNSDISQQYLDMVQADFDKIRQSGLKMIPRFAYSESAGANLTPPYNDASKERILSHINQLSSVLRENSDVIALMQAGFIGLWGEWWYSDHFRADADSNERAEVLFGILDALPTTRMVQLRTPRYKQNIFSDTTPVDLVIAHKGSDKARTGHHNDCFVSGLSDGGTYVNVSTEYPYLEEETKWVPMGGETCDYNALSDRDSSRLECAIALNELARFHWSFLNISWYQPLLRKWQNDGCFTEIERRLGYYLTLLEGTYDSQVKPGDNFKFSLVLKNEGFSAPFNPRAAELILRHTDGSTHALKLPSDPRFWLPGNTTHTISDKISIPKNFPPGQYELLLNLPDPEPRLRQRPEYSIRLANEKVWEEKTGYNKLNHTVTVESPVYYPDAVGIMVGKYDMGSLASFVTSDDDTYDIRGLAVSNGKATDWYASTTILALQPSMVSELTVTYSGQYSRKGVNQNIYLYNYRNAHWDLIDTRAVGNTDDVTVRVTILTPQAYLSSNGQSRIRMNGFRKGKDQLYSWANFLSWEVR